MGSNFELIVGRMEMAREKNASEAEEARDGKNVAAAGVAKGDK